MVRMACARRNLGRTGSAHDAHFHAVAERQNSGSGPAIRTVPERHWGHDPVTETGHIGERHCSWSSSACTLPGTAGPHRCAGRLSVRRSTAGHAPDRRTEEAFDRGAHGG